jgi:hypothetical protein
MVSLEKRLGERERKSGKCTRPVGEVKPTK